MKPQHWVVYGNDVHSWSTALFLHSNIPPQHLTISVVRCAPNGQPPQGLHLGYETLMFHQHIGIDETEFLTSTKASICLATEFLHWSQAGSRLLFSGSAYGEMIGRVEFFHCLQTLRKNIDVQLPHASGELYNINTCAATLNRFSPVPSHAPAVFHHLQHGYQVNEAHYCRYLESLARTRNIKIINACAIDQQLPKPGDKQLQLTSFEDEKFQLAFDFLITTQSAKDRAHGWQNCDGLIPKAVMQYSAEPAHEHPLYRLLKKSPEGWQDTLVSQKETFIVNYQKQSQCNSAEVGFDTVPWQLNQLYLGHALCQLGNCYSNTLTVTQRALWHLLDLFPYQPSVEKAQEFNRLTSQDCARLLDLHNFIYWCAGIVDQKTTSLDERIDLFIQQGVCRQSEQEFIDDSSWQVLMAELYQWPKNTPRQAQHLDYNNLEQQLNRLAQHTGRATNSIPPFNDFLGFLTKAKSP